MFDGIFFPGTRKQKYIDLNVSLVFASLLLKLSRLDNIFFLNDKEIATAIYYPKTLPSLPAHSVKEKFPVAENICNEILSLPIWPGITLDQIDYIVLSIEEYFNS